MSISRYLYFQFLCTLQLKHCITWLPGNSICYHYSFHASADPMFVPHLDYTHTMIHHSCYPHYYCDMVSGSLTRFTQSRSLYSVGDARDASSPGGFKPVQLFLGSYRRVAGSCRSREEIWISRLAITACLRNQSTEDGVYTRLQQNSSKLEVRVDEPLANGRGGKRTIPKVKDAVIQAELAVYYD